MKPVKVSTCYLITHKERTISHAVDLYNFPIQGIVGSGMCYVGMAWCVKKRGPLFTAAFNPLVQIMAAMFDIPFLHEELHLGR